MMLDDSVENERFVQMAQMESSKWSVPLGRTGHQKSETEGGRWGGEGGGWIILLMQVIF